MSKKGDGDTDAMHAAVVAIEPELDIRYGLIWTQDGFPAEDHKVRYFIP
ncbi:hypothetical protein OJE16_10480 [Pantoea tagorei]